MVTTIGYSFKMAQVKTMWMISKPVFKLSLQFSKVAAWVGQLSPLYGTTLWQAIMTCSSLCRCAVDWQTLFSYMPQPVCCDLTLWPLVSLSCLTIQCCNELLALAHPTVFHIHLVTNWKFNYNTGRLYAQLTMCCSNKFFTCGKSMLCQHALYPSQL